MYPLPCFPKKKIWNRITNSELPTLWSSEAPYHCLHRCCTLHLAPPGETQGMENTPPPQYSRMEAQEGHPETWRALGASPFCFLLISWARHKIWTQNHFRGKTLAFFSTAKSTSPIKYMAKFGIFYQPFSEIQGSPFGNVCQFKWVSV